MNDWMTCNWAHSMIFLMCNRLYNPRTNHSANLTGHSSWICWLILAPGTMGMSPIRMAGCCLWCHFAGAWLWAQPQHRRAQQRFEGEGQALDPRVRNRSPTSRLGERHDPLMGTSKNRNYQGSGRKHGMWPRKKKVKKETNRKLFEQCEFRERIKNQMCSWAEQGATREGQGCQYQAQECMELESQTHMKIC